MEPFNPPHSMIDEQSVLGSVILDSSCLDKIGYIKPEDFYLREHSSIFEIMLSYHNDGKAIDAVTLSADVGDNLGGYAYLIDLMRCVGSVRNVVAYADKVLDYSVRRKAIAEMQSCIDSMCDSSSDYMSELSNCENNINTQIGRKSTGLVMTIDELIDQSVNEMEKSNQVIRTGVKTGIPEIDERLGYNNIAFGEITVFGGLSKNGKTLFVNTAIARMDLQDDEVAHVFSVEMSSAQMFNGIISARTGVPANFYARQAYYQQYYSEYYAEWMAKWGEAATELRESRKFNIDGTKQVDADYICSQMRKQSALARNSGKKLRVVVLDHFHRMDFHSGNGPMTYAMRDSVRKLKNTAADLGVALIVLAQLRNDAQDKDPTSFHILDTSALRHELQCFVGFRMFREDGNTFFGVYTDSHRYADMDTKFDPAYVMLVGGVINSLPSGMENWKPKLTNEQ